MMMTPKYELRITSKMKKDVRKCKKRGLDLDKLKTITDTLCAGIPLAPQHHDHALSGGWVGYRECHIENDWLLIYTINEGELILFASRTGTHADFGW
jgi:mRNA interferase YafQ